MKWAEISVQTTQEATEAVANIFHDLGTSGVVIEDPELINSYRHSGTWDYCGIPEDDTGVVTVTAYLPVDNRLHESLRLFEQRLNELSLHNIDKGIGTIRWREVHEEDWSSAWKQFFHPVKIGDRVVIKPSWEDYQPAEGEIIIELDPGMAFGTGTHHTTQMCIQCLEEILVPGCTVFDIGTGSGILAIAAAKLGAKDVRAVDLDPVAVKIAGENVCLNGVQEQVTLSEGDLLTGIAGSDKADLIIANIIADVIIRMAPDLPLRLKDEGAVIASGIIATRLSDVIAALGQVGLVVEKIVEEGTWAAVIARRGGM
ncbi:MAG: prmA [Firmicutes bacterium]|nr:prmA [Bacillota bacterium]